MMTAKGLAGRTALAGAALLLGCCSVAESQPAAAAQKPAVPANTSTNFSMENYQKPSSAELKQKLTPMQYQVTQHASTEPPFRNPYWDNKKAGIYVDVVSEEQFFSSLDNFNPCSACPTFTRPMPDHSSKKHPVT